LTVRVVSLVPSVSESLVAWGLIPVAVTRFCEQPGLTTVGGTKNPDIAAIVALTPDLVVLDREENRREDAAALEAAGVAIHVTHVRRVSDVGPMLSALRAAVRLDADAAGPGDDRPATDGIGAAGLRVWVPMLEACGLVNVFAGHPDRYPTVSLDEVNARRPDVVLAPTEPYAFGERHRHLFADVAPMVAVDGQDLFWWGVRTQAALSRLRGHMASLRL
jgi:ABC-type Fe3+-hydroxamate transport system substrate-binding protein